MPAEHLTPASSSPALQISSSPAQPANYNDALQFKTQCKWRKVKQLQLSILQLAPAQVSGSCKTTTMLSSSQWRNDALQSKPSAVHSLCCIMLLYSCIHAAIK